MADDLHLIIANKAYSSWSMRPWIALKVLGVPFRETVIGLALPDTAVQIAKYSDAGKVPVLKHGDITVWESVAILEYLTETFPTYAWWPKDAKARATARSIAAEMHAGFSALRSSMSMNLRKTFPPRERSAELQKDIDRIATLWRDARKSFGAGGPFLFGAFSNADAMYAPVVTRFKTYGVKLDSEAQAYYETMLALPAMKQWYDDAANEAWVVEKYERMSAGLPPA